MTLINVFTVPAGKEAEAIVFWEKAANFLKNQPGYISTKLHKSVQPNAKHGLINVAKWESAEAFKRASAAMRAKSGIKPVKGLSFAAALYTVIRSD
ncbi:MAG: antibiotic biosynthesis monooxygenase family protein [Pseudomonadota bacterium]